MNSVQKQSVKICRLSDKELLSLCKRYGLQARLWRQKFIGLLPEVNKRKLYKKRGCQSIHEFAAKFAGVSKEHVNRVINLEERFESVPKLKGMLIYGKVSSNKLAKIASVVTKENEDEIIEVVQKLPCRSLETYVRDLKSENGIRKPKNEGELVHVNKLDMLQKLDLSEDVLSQLIELKEKGLDINELLQEFLAKREKVIQDEKARVTSEVVSNEEMKKSTGKKVSRYVPVKVRNILKKEYGAKCVIPGCKKEAKTIHHTARFSISRSHNPYFMAPLCKGHHDIAHMVDEKYAVNKNVVLRQ